MKIHRNFWLTDFNSYRIPAQAEKVYLPESVGDIRAIFQNNPAEKKTILGGGYNVILSNNHYPNQAFVLLRENFSKTQTRPDHRIFAQAGAELKSLSELALKKAWAGLEYFYDIPGTLGGALVMNAGAQGEDIAALTESVTWLHIPSGEIRLLPGPELAATYRQSFFQDNPDAVILDATLQLRPGDPDAIQKKMRDNQAARHARQPKDLPNAGSVFKRPPGFFVGKMVEDLGLKGFAIGGAQISEKHAGFIVNTGSATGADILAIIEVVRQRVRENFGLELVLEQKVI